MTSAASVARIPDKDRYRQLWRELPAADRRRIVRAVNRGRAVESRREAALAVVTARSQQRFWSKAWLLGPIATLFALGQGWQAYLINAVMGTAVLGAMAYFWTRRAARAERANLAVADPRAARDDSRDDPAEDDEPPPPRVYPTGPVQGRGHVPRRKRRG